MWSALREQLYGEKVVAGQVGVELALCAELARAGRGRGGPGADPNLGSISLSPASSRNHFATADSQAPGIYATAFYSKPAQAQVVWLNGMEPATDQPTYLDPTTVVPRHNNRRSPAQRSE